MAGSDSTSVRESCVGGWGGVGVVANATATNWSGQRVCANAHSLCISCLCGRGMASCLTAVNGRGRLSRGRR